MTRHDAEQVGGRDLILQRVTVSPEFGKATLENCEREQIHLAGSIQSHGALMILREPELVVVQASSNLGEFLHFETGPCLGLGLDVVAPQIEAALRELEGEMLDSLPVAVRCEHDAAGALDLIVHRPASGGLLVEIEHAGAAVTLAGAVEAGLRSIVSAASLPGLCDEAAWVFREITGYDRVMVYRFDDEGHGEVVSEHRRADLEALLGNRYPASDIPQIARKLYVRNRTRVLVDVDFSPIAILPRHAPDTGAEPDMSLCVLRSPSPIHVQYLKNMGVRATLVISLLVNNKLWGLISCHHYAPRQMGFEARAVCEFLAEAVATRIAALESFLQSQVELAVRQIEQRIIDAIAREGDWRAALFDGTTALLAPLGATGAALLFDGQCLTVGEVPGTQQLRSIGLWLDSQVQAGIPRASVFATTALSIDDPRFVPIADVASGLVAVSVSATGSEYLMWFRPEQVRTVTWGGDPNKPMEIGTSVGDLSPRRSFAQWHQRVVGTSANWSAAELTAARLIGETLSDVVLQFRAVRLLIAEEQLIEVSRDVAAADQPVLIANQNGRLLQSNPAFQALLPQGVPAPTHFDDLPELFHEVAEIQRRLMDLRFSQRTWRGEALLKLGEDEHRAMLVRADPVFAAPDRVLGYIILFTDLTDRKEAERARRQFQEGIAEGQRRAAARLESQAGVAARNLLASMLENAQLAAMEITDGVDAIGIAHRLESVRASVQRAAEMLERLLRHGARPG